MGRHGGSAAVRQLPWRRLRNPYQPLEIVSADELEAIHLTSLKVLEELGIEFLSEAARRRLKAAGADVRPDGPLVRFDRALTMELVARAPSSFTLTPRNPARALSFGGDSIAFNSVGGPEIGRAHV